MAEPPNESRADIRVSERVPRAQISQGSDPTTLLLLGVRFAGVLETLIARVFSDTAIKWGLPSTVALALGVLWSLPPTDRLEAIAQLPKLLDSLGKTIAADTLAWSGWGLLIVFLCAAVPFMVQQHKRIRAQGDENAALRKLVDPERLSSRQPEQLDLYDVKARNKYKK